MKKHNVRKKSRDGFTLVELVVVIAILGILSSIAVPKLGGFTDTAKKVADEQLNEVIKNIIKLSYVADEIALKGDEGSIAVSNLESTDNTTALNFEVLENGIIKGSKPIKIGDEDEVISAIIDKLEKNAMYQIKNAKFEFTLKSDGEVSVEKISEK